MLGWNEQWVVLPRHRCSITFPRLPDLRLALRGRHAISLWRQWSLEVGGPCGSRFQARGGPGNRANHGQSQLGSRSGLSAQVFLLPWGHLGPRARKGEGGVNRGKGGERARGKGKEAGREGVEGEGGGESGKQPQVTGDFSVTLPHNTAPPHPPHPPALQMAK